MPPSKNRRSLATPAPSYNTMLLSSISSLTFSSHGSYNGGGGTNQAINDILYGGDTPTSIQVSSPLTTSNMGLCCNLLPEVLQLRKQTKLVLVLAMTSPLLPLFKGVVLQDVQDVRQSHQSLDQTFRLQLGNEVMEKQHKFKHLGKSYFEF
jgi:hypothetical protein